MLAELLSEAKIYLDLLTFKKTSHSAVLFASTDHNSTSFLNIFLHFKQKYRNSCKKDDGISVPVKNVLITGLVKSALHPHICQIWQFKAV